MNDFDEIIRFALIVVFYTIPVFFNLLVTKKNIEKSFAGAVILLNKSFKFQFAFWIILIPFGYLSNKFDYTFNGILTDVWYWSFTIGLFFYLPILGFLNLIRLIPKLRKKKS